MKFDTSNPILEDDQVIRKREPKFVLIGEVKASNADHLVLLLEVRAWPARITL